MGVRKNTGGGEQNRSKKVFRPILNFKCHGVTAVIKYVY